MSLSFVLGIQTPHYSEIFSAIPEHACFLSHKCIRIYVLHYANIHQKEIFTRSSPISWSTYVVGIIK